MTTPSEGPPGKFPLVLGLDTFGDLTHDENDRPLSQGQVIRDLVEHGVLAEQVGVDFFGIGEHHTDDFPLSAADVKDFIRAPRAARKLFGYQGLPAVDIGALEELAGRLAWMKDNHPEIALVEFNPVLCGPQGVSILAADIRIGNAAQRTDSARRAMLG
jgi:hypothetical protein